MNDVLYRLVYVSRNLIEGDAEEIRREIGGILEISRRNNLAGGVTGALMFNHGCFAQVLEGTHDAVQDTFERIQCDERHDDVRLLAFDAVAERAFGNWSMAYVGEDWASREAFVALASDGALDPDAMPPGRIYALLKEHLADAEERSRAA